MRNLLFVILLMGFGIVVMQTLASKPEGKVQTITKEGSTITAKEAGIVIVDPDKIDLDQPYAFELHDLKMAMFGMKCKKIDPIVAKKVEAVLLPMMYQEAHPENAYPFADQRINDLAKQAEKDGTDLGAVACNWWATDPGKKRFEKVMNVARFYTP